MSYFNIDKSELERLEKTMKEFPSVSEKAINSVLHEEAGDILQTAIKGFMPVSNRKWKGKSAGAKGANSLQNDNGQNLSVTVRTKKTYQYLYFPDDGTNTKRHAGNKQFFKHGGEEKQSEIIDKCIEKITESIK